MSNVQAFGITRNAFFVGDNINLFKHSCPPEFSGGPLDPVTPNRQFHLALMKSFALPLPDSVAATVGTNQLPMWIIENKDVEIKRAFPSPLLRMVQGEIIHAHVESAGDTHTIHWHGIEPTPMNDGVGKHSFEIHGFYVYQFQANEAGTYFYHCHRNTTLHFEMGLYGGLIIDPPAPPDSGLAAPYVTGGPGFVSGRLNPQESGNVLRYDSEKIWVADELDSRWHFPEPDHKHNMQKCDATAPSAPGTFYKANSTTFDLNNFRPNIFVVSGVVMDAAAGPPYMGVINDPAIRIDARVGEQVLLRYVNASYMIQELILPVDATVIAWDGRALGVGASQRFSYPYVVPAGTPIRTTSARRCNVMLNTGAPVAGMAQICYYDWLRGKAGGMVAQVEIPVNVS